MHRTKKISDHSEGRWTQSSNGGSVEGFGQNDTETTPLCTWSFGLGFQVCRMFYNTESGRQKCLAPDGITLRDFITIRLLTDHWRFQPERSLFAEDAIRRFFHLQHWSSSMLSSFSGFCSPFGGRRVTFYIPWERSSLMGVPMILEVEEWQIPIRLLTRMGFLLERYTQ